MHTLPPTSTVQYAKTQNFQEFITAAPVENVSIKWIITAFGLKHA